MASQFFHLRLRPEADGTGRIFRLRLSITIRGLSLQPGGTLFVFGRQDVTNEYPSWNPYYKPHDIMTLFSDDDGDLSIRKSGESTHEHPVERQTRGDVVAAWKVPAAERSDASEEGPASVCKLLGDQDGILGVGKYFIPRFSLGDRVNIAVEWDLDNCPQGIRVVTSFGEGPQGVKFKGDADSLLDCVFMAGPVRSNTDGQPPDLQIKNPCSTYWFGDLPPNLDAETGYATNIFPRMETTGT